MSDDPDLELEQIAAKLQIAKAEVLRRALSLFKYGGIEGWRRELLRRFATLVNKGPIYRYE